MLTLKQKKEKLRLLRIKKILQCRSSFWEYQKINAPRDFNDARTYLACLSLSLQSFYINEPVHYLLDYPIKHHKKLDLSKTTIDIEFTQKGDRTWIEVNCSDTDIILIEVPRRHHKSHTLINFEDWVFGQDPKEIIITAAHNADLAMEFSQYVRNGIEQERLRAFDIIYSDIFPKTRTTFGDRSKKRWALDGSFLSYAGSGILFPVTGKGGGLGVFDDPIKGPKEAFNEIHLDKVWENYSTGWLPCLEPPRKQVFVMTPWVQGDPGDRVVEGAKDSGEVVKIFNCRAYTPEQGMLCDEILDKRAFNILESRMDPVIFSGNFLSTRIPLVGRMYTSFKFYTIDDMPENFDEIFCYIDTADTGADFLCSPIAGIKYGKDEFGLHIKEAYTIDVLYTQEGLEITEQMVIDFLVKNNIQNSTNVLIEAQTGGHYFAENIKKKLRNDHPKEKIYINTLHQTENKNARINANSNTIMKYVYFPASWRTINKHWTGYSDAMMRYSREGKNTHDDAPDATTGLAEHINTELTMLDAIKMRRRS